MDRDLRLKMIFDALDRFTKPVREMGRGSKKLTQDIKATTKQLGALNREQKKVGKFRELRSGLVANRKALTKTKSEIRDLKKEIASVDRPTRKMTAALKKAEQTEKRLSRAIEKQTGDLRKQQSELRESGVDTAKLGRHQADLKKKIEGTNRQLERQTGSLSKFNRMQKTANKVKSVAGRGGAAATAGVTGPVAYLAKQSFQAAMDAQELQSAHDAVFGKQAAAMNYWAEKTGNALGRSTQRLQASNMAYQELFGKSMDPKKAAEMSKQYTLLTQDLASFKNLSDDEAQQKLFSGLVGESEPLRRMGVIIDETMVKERAMAMGLEKVNGKYTQQQKLLVRAALIKEQLATADGDVIKTSGSTANQLKKLSDTFDEMKVAIGEKLLPAITPLIEKLSAMLERFNELSPGTQQFIVIALGLAAVIGPLLLIVAGLAAGFSVLAGAVAVLASPFVLIGILIAAVVGVFIYAGYQIYQNWEKIKETMAAGHAYVWEVLISIKNKFLEWIGFLVSIPARVKAIGTNIALGIANGILSGGTAVFNALKSIVMKPVSWVKNWLGIKSPSRMFMAFGDYMAQGMALGLDRGGSRAIRSAAKMAASVAAAGSLAIQPAGATPLRSAGAANAAKNASGGNVTMYVSIKVDGADGDAKQLAKKIKTELDKMAGVAMRSDFDDG